MPPLAEGEEGSNARSANAGSGESGVGGIVGDPGNGQPTNPANHQTPFTTEYPPSVDASDAVDQRALEEAATAAAYQAAAEAKMRRSTGSATSGGPGQEDGGLTTPAPTIFAPGHLPPDEYAVVRDAAASEMRRDRVTALDAVEGLNVDANRPFCSMTDGCSKGERACRADAVEGAIDHCGPCRECGPRGLCGAKATDEPTQSEFRDCVLVRCVSDFTDGGFAVDQ